MIAHPQNTGTSRFRLGFRFYCRLGCRLGAGPIVGTLALLAAALGSAPGCSKESGGQPAAHAAPASQEAQAARPAAAQDDTAQDDTAKAEPGQAAGGTVYGAGVAGAEQVTIAQLLASPDAYAGKTVQVEGMVTDVCPKRGCWFEMAGSKPGETMRFKVQDGVMVFPMDAKGKHAVAEGVVSTQTLSLEETRQYLTYQAKEYGKDVDPESVTEPMTIVRLDGKGAVLRDGK